MKNQPDVQNIARKLTVEEYMEEFKIGSRTTVYKRMDNGTLEYEDLNKGKSIRRDIRIIVRDHQPLQAAA